VVRANIALALPHLSDKERLAIEKNHTIIYVIYGNDKTMTISSEEMNRRFVITNIEL
jgi:KDO2-lipid IV(A) lauroyltransferase